MAYKNIEDSRAAIRKHYAENKGYYKDKAKKRRQRIAGENKEKIRAILLDNPCACGENDIVVLEFSHRDRSEKSANVSRMVLDGLAWEVIKEEIDKCDVKCANCHKRETARQFGWWKDTPP